MISNQNQQVRFHNKRQKIKTKEKYLLKELIFKIPHTQIDNIEVILKRMSNNKVEIQTVEQRISFNNLNVTKSPIDSEQHSVRKQVLEPNRQALIPQLQSKPNHQKAHNFSKSNCAKSEIVSASNIESLTQKNNKNKKAQSIASQPQVVRHKIYTIKPIEMANTSQQSNVKNVSKQVDNKKRNVLKQDVKQKQIKAISNVFGQFFKLENMRNYSKPAQTDKVKIQNKTQNKIQNKTQNKTQNKNNQQQQPQNLYIKIQSKPQYQPRVYQPRVISSRTQNQQIKISQSKIHKKQDQIKPNIILTQTFKLQQVQKIIPSSVQKLQTPVKLNGKQNQPVLIIPPVQNDKIEAKQDIYSQPDFNFLEIQQILSKVTHLKKSAKKVQDIKSNQPQINFLQQQQERVNSKQQDNLGEPLKQFIDNNDFTHPLIQSLSRESFPLCEPKQTLSQNATNKNLLEKQSPNKNQISLKPMYSLGNLQPIQIKKEKQNISEQEVVYTPFFQQKIRHSQSDQGQSNYFFNQCNKFIANDKIIVQDKNTVMNVPRNSQLQQSSPPKNEIKTHQNHLTPNRNLNNQNDLQLLGIQKMFVKFNTQNKLMIDPLSFESGFQTLQEVTSNLINQMDKQQEDLYVCDIVGNRQQQWRQRLFKNHIKQNDELTYTKINRQLLSIQSPIKTTYEIKQPKPTQVCSPSKNQSYNMYENINSSPGAQNKSKQQSILIKNKTPLRLPVFEHNNINHHVQQDTDMKNSSLHSFYEEKQNPDSQIILPLQSAQKQQHYDKKIRPSLPFNQSLTVQEQPSSILHSVENQRSNIEQIEQIRQFYNYLRSRESTYYGNEKTHSPYHESLPQSQQIQESNLSDKNQKSIKAYQNIHEIKQTSKPVIGSVQSARNHNDRVGSTYVNNNQILETINEQVIMSSSKDIESPSKMYSKQKKSLQSVVLSFRRSNYIGDHKNFKQQVVSCSESHQNCDHEDPHISFIEHPKQKGLFYQNSARNNSQQKLLTYQQNVLKSNEKHNLQHITFPIQKIQPIRVTSMNKHHPTTIEQTKVVSKSPQNKDNSSSTMKKIKLVSVNFTPASKPIQIPSIIKPPHINSFLFSSSHIGSFMLNNVIKSYINTHPNKNNDSQINILKQSQILDSKITKEDENKLQSATKKKISIKKNPNSAKKLSINQKSFTTQIQNQQKTLKSRIQNDEYITESQFHKLNPQLKQTISRVNQHKQKQLYKLIKSRITEKQNSRASSSQYNKSPQHTNLNNDVNLDQNNSFINEFKFQSKQFYTQRMNNNSSKRKGYQSNSKDKSLVKSRNSSKSSRKSGLQLWNAGLSQLKSSRKQNNVKQLKIFNQQNTRKDDKIIGITKWNENIAKYKQSRSRSNQSHLSSKSKSKQNIISQLLTKNQANKQLQQKIMNIEIKKYKHQVSNVQKKYL